MRHADFLDSHRLVRHHAYLPLEICVLPTHDGLEGMANNVGVGQYSHSFGCESLISLAYVGRLDCEVHDDFTYNNECFLLMYYPCPQHPYPCL